MQVALVHDWLLGMRGGERVLEELCALFPGATVHTFFHEPGAVSPTIESHAIHTSFVDSLPGARRHHRMTLPLLPFAAELLRLPPCDLVISTSHCVAGAVRAPRGTPHLCICFTPMRYLWGMDEAYVPNAAARAAYRTATAPLRWWHRRTHSRVDRFVAISRYVRDRIARVHGRDAEVVYPPVDVERFRPRGKSEDYFLVVSALVPYKRIDLVLETFRHRTEEVRIAGAGPLADSLRSQAPPNARFMGWVPEEELPQLVAGARALIFPTEDEFGLVPVEAMACGRPVIAFGRGGAAETVVPLGLGPEPTGIWFRRQTPEALGVALDQFIEAEQSFDPESIRAHALQYASRHFHSEVRRIAAELVR